MRTGPNGVFARKREDGRTQPAGSDVEEEAEEEEEEEVLIGGQGDGGGGYVGGPGSGFPRSS